MRAFNSQPCRVLGALEITWRYFSTGLGYLCKLLAYNRQSRITSRERRIENGKVILARICPVISAVSLPKGSEIFDVPFYLVIEGSCDLTNIRYECVYTLLEPSAYIRTPYKTLHFHVQ